MDSNNQYEVSTLVLYPNIFLNSSHLLFFSNLLLPKSLPSFLLLAYIFLHASRFPSIRSFFLFFSYYSISFSLFLIFLSILCFFVLCFCYIFFILLVYVKNILFY